MIHSNYHNFHIPNAFGYDVFIYNYIYIYVHMAIQIYRLVEEGGATQWSHHERAHIALSRNVFELHNYNKCDLQ